jgi:chaperone required for assembly of F1-ATPase
MSSQPSHQRFYKSASFAEQASGGFAVLLDGCPVQTPGGQPLKVPARDLAKAIASEWESQGESIDPASLPLTRLANSAIDGVAGREGEVAGDILKYAAADLVCYRAAYPAGLAEAQAKLWNPVLAWIKERYDAPFLTGVGIAHVTQPPSSLAALRTALGSFGAFKLTALHAMTPVTGSALIALTYAGGGLDVSGAWAAALADENWQVSQWGEDFEAAQRQKNRFAEFESAARFFALS